MVRANGPFPGNVTDPTNRSPTLPPIGIYDSISTLPDHCGLVGLAGPDWDRTMTGVLTPREWPQRSVKGAGSEVLVIVAGH